MDTVRAAAPQLAGLVPYDPKYLPAEALLSANESPIDIPPAVREQVRAALARLELNRYPDPLANGLRDAIAAANGLRREQVLVGNGGDELLFDLALAWGGPGRAFLNLPPTFSVYAANARLTGTRVVDVARTDGYAIDEDAVLARVARGDIDFVVVTSPNNPTGACAPLGLIERLLQATDALVLVDEAYCEFAGTTALPLLEAHENLALLRTFSKAYALAGVRLGYVLAHEGVISELAKVRQPYSVDAVSQVIGRVVLENRAAFQPAIDAIVAERGRVTAALAAMDGVEPYPSDANWALFRLEGTGGATAAATAAAAWEYLYDQGVLVRDFSSAFMLEGCLRATIGTAAQNDALLAALGRFLESA